MVKNNNDLTNNHKCVILYLEPKLSYKYKKVIV